jgi:hypothetical protein
VAHMHYMNEPGCNPYWALLYNDYS